MDETKKNVAKIGWKVLRGVCVMIAGAVAATAVEKGFDHFESNDQGDATEA